MTTSAGSENIAIVIQAEDRASRKIKQVGDSLRKNLGGSVRSAALSMISFTSILSGVGLSITALIVVAKKFVGEIIKTNRAAALIGTQFRLMGFSVDRASSAVSRLRENLSRAALQGFATLDEETRKYIASLGDPGLKNLDDLTNMLSELADISKKQAFIDLAKFFAGDTEALKKYNLTVETAVELDRELRRGFQDMLDNQTALERFWRALKNAASQAMRSMVDDVNDAFGDRGIVGIVRGSLNIIGVAFGSAGLGDRMAEQMTAVMNAIKNFDLGTVVAKGREIGQRLVLAFWSGVVRNFNLVKSAIETALDMSIAALIPTLLEQGKRMAIWIWSGFKSLLGGALNLGRVIMGALRLPNLFQQGVGLARGLAQGMLNGLRSNLQTVATFLVNRTNDLIGRINRAIPRRFELPRVGRITIPRAPQMGGGQFQRHQQGAGPLQFVPNGFSQPISIQMNGREVARVVAEVLDGQLRIRQPGLMIT